MNSIFITGANEGIGYYMVQQFLEDGASVTVLDVNIEQLIALQEKFPQHLLPIKGDVQDATAVNNAIYSAVERFHGIDSAIHNACFCPFASFEELSDADSRHTFDVNYFGGVNLCRSVLPVMKRQGNGRVFFTSSAVGITGFSGISAYASTKGALESLSKCLSLEYEESGISFHLLHPPLTRTQSAKPLPIPEEIKVEPAVVGRGLAKRMNKNKFVLCHSRPLRFQTRLMYLFPLAMGKLLNKAAKRMTSQSR